MEFYAVQNDSGSITYVPVIKDIYDNAALASLYHGDEWVGGSAQGRELV